MEKIDSESKSWLGIGLFAAFAASICCITPVLAILGGISGIASTFSWLEPFRPFLIATTVLVLGFAIYKAYKPKKTEDSCNCEVEVEDRKTKVFNSKAFLWIVTLVVLLMLSFPYYSQLIIPKDNKQAVPQSQQSNVAVLKLDVKGMTCQSCENHVNHELSSLKGVIHSTTSYEEGTTIVKYDSTKTSKEEIVKAVNNTGYKVSKIERK